MHVVFSHACRHEWLDKNPMSLVRQSAKREKLPDVLELEELKKLLGELQDPARLLVFLTAATGLRVSEALGLKWSDVDFSGGALQLARAIVHQHVGEMKTEASQKPVPIDGTLLEALTDWNNRTAYRGLNNWVFASPDVKGKKPYWPETLLRCHVHPAAKRLKIAKSLGWHSLPKNVRDSPKWRGRGRKDSPGTDAARKQQIDAGCVRTGFEPSKAGGPSKVG
jgi:integrase